MKRLGTLVMAILVITGCNAIQPNVEEAELLWTETEKNIQTWAITTKAEASPAEKPRNTPEPTVEISQKTPELAEKPAPHPPLRQRHRPNQPHLNRKSPSNLNRKHLRKQNDPRNPR